MGRNLSPTPGVSDKQLHGMVGTAAVFLLFITIFISFRVWDLFRRWKTGLHDVFALISYVAGSIMFGTEMYMYTQGFGVPRGQVTADRSALSAKVLFAFSITFITALSFAVFSFAVFYWKLFSTPICRRIIAALLALEFANATARYFVAFFQCTPVRKAFNPAIHGKCIDRTFAFAGAVIVDFMVTLTLFIIPIVQLWKVKVARGKKAGIMFMLACGMAIALTNAVCIYTVFESKFGTKKFSPLLNVIITNVQILIAHLCLNMPSIYHLVQRRFPQLGRRLRLGNADEVVNGIMKAPAPVEPEWPETIGQRRINKDARARERSLFSDGSLFSNMLRRGSLRRSRHSGVRDQPKTLATQYIVVESPNATYNGRSLSIRPANAQSQSLA